MSPYIVNGHTQNWEGFAMQTTAVIIPRIMVDLYRSVGPGLVIYRLNITFFNSMIINTLYNQRESRLSGTYILSRDVKWLWVMEDAVVLTASRLQLSPVISSNIWYNLIAATSLVILLKFDPNHRFFSPCDLEIWWMTWKNNRAPLLYYIKLCVSFQIRWWIQTGVTVRKRPIWVKIDDFF